VLEQDCESLRNNQAPKRYEKQLQHAPQFGQIWALSKKAHDSGERHPKLVRHLLLVDLMRGSC
jgi:hypothetical protein